MTLPYRRRLESDDWRKKRDLLRWLYSGKCPTCGGTLPPETHHNSEAAYLRMPHERPDDLIPLCTACHAAIELAKRYQPDIVELARARKRSGRLRVAIEDVAECLDRQVREIVWKLNQAEEELDLLLAMTRAGQEGEERRAA